MLMSLLTGSPAEAGRRRAPIRRGATGLWFLPVGGAWVATFLLFGERDPQGYEALLQEDRQVEWATVALFLAAGIAGLVRAVRTRRLFDGLVALFCFVVAAEEVSWGQRLLGFYPPEFFLRNNFQQELSFHNLPQAYLQSKWFLAAVLAAYGVALPLLATAKGPRAVMSRVGASGPPPALVPMFLAAILLLAWYPLPFTGEWVEALAGGLFLVSALPALMPNALAFMLVAGFGFGMTGLGAAIERGRDAGRVECAAAETRALLDDVASMGGATAKLWEMSHLHKRVWSSIVEEYVDAMRLPGFTSMVCLGPWGDSTSLRHRYGIDPWGTPYWLLVDIGNDEQRVSVYSFGPNRRRDVSTESIANSDAGDDVIATEAVRAKP
jgi:hypothetical protein